MTYTLGVIGAGNIGLAFLYGALKATQNLDLAPSRFLANTGIPSANKALQSQFDSEGFKVEVVDNEVIAKEADVVILAIKPLHMKTFTIKFHKNPSIISLVTGATLAELDEKLQSTKIIFRGTTNTAAKIGVGMSAFCANHEIGDYEAEFETCRWLFSQLGEYVEVAEHQVDACVSLCGSAPAFTYLFADALIDGGVKAGLPFETAKKCAAQVLKGSGQMLLDGGHPGVLKNAITTPGGTTISGLAVLEDNAVRGAVLRAVEEAYKVAKSL